MRKIILLIAVAVCTALSSCNNDEPAQKDVVAYFDADGMPHLFDEDQYTTQQIIDKLKNRILLQQKTIYLLDNKGRVTDVEDYWESHCSAFSRPFDNLGLSFGYYTVMLDDHVIKLHPSSKSYFLFSEYPYDSASETKFMDRVFENSRPAKICDHYLYETGIFKDGTPYYAKVYFGSDKLFDKLMQEATLHPTINLYDPSL